MAEQGFYGVQYPDNSFGRRWRAPSLSGINIPAAPSTTSLAGASKAAQTTSGLAKVGSFLSGAAPVIGAAATIADLIMSYNAAKKQEKENFRVERLNRSLLEDEKRYNREVDAYNRQEAEEEKKYQRKIAKYNQYTNFLNSFANMLNQKPKTARAMIDMWRR